MNSKDDLPQEEFEKTVIISHDDNVTIKLSQEADSSGSKTAVKCSNVTGTLRNADREIKLAIAGEAPIPEIFAEEKPPKNPPKASIKTVAGEIITAGMFPIVRTAAIIKMSTEDESIPMPVPIAMLIRYFLKDFLGTKKRSPQISFYKRIFKRKRFYSVIDYFSEAFSFAEISRNKFTIL